MEPFTRALQFVLDYEGGFVDNPADPGGATNHGITQAVYDEYRLGRGFSKRSVRDITSDEYEYIYRHSYWAPIAERYADDGHPGLALYVFDSCVQHGVERVKHWMDNQRRELLMHPVTGLTSLHAVRVNYYVNLTAWGSFGRGWMRRVTAALSAAVSTESPDGLIRAKHVNVDGVTYVLDIARRVNSTIWVKTVPKEAK